MAQKISRDPADAFVAADRGGDIAPVIEAALRAADGRAKRFAALLGKGHRGVEAIECEAILDEALRFIRGLRAVDEADRPASDVA